MHAHEFVEVLRSRGYQVKQHGGEWRCQCPAHDGKDLNLSISDGDEAVVCRCWSKKCSLHDIARAVGVKETDLWHQPRPLNGSDLPPATVFPYRDEAGRVLYEVRRMPGKKPGEKDFKMWLPGAQFAGIGKTRRVLFGLPELLKTEPGELVVIAEGEKCAMAVALLGLAATTNPNGAGTWRADYTEWLKEHLADRRFLVLPDNDEEGKKHALAVCDQLKAAGLKVWLANLGELPDKGDVVQWIGRGGTAEQLRAMAADAPPKLWPRLLSFAQLLTQPAPSWLIEDFAFEETMAEIYGPPNEGKTFLAVDLCMSIRRGVPWCGRSVDRPGPVLYVNADGGPGFADRGRAWVLIHGESEAPHEFWTLPEPINLYREDALNELSALISYLPERPVLLVIDTYSRCIPGVNENQQEFASLVIDNLTRLMREFHLSTWLLHHTDKTGKHDRGSSVILGACDTQVRVSLNQQTRIIELKCEKQRDNAFFAPIYFDLGRVPGTNETWVTWRQEAPPVNRQDRSEAAVDAVREAIRRDPGITRAQLYVGLELPETTLRRHLFKLLERGQVIETELPREPGKAGAPVKGLFLNARPD